MKISIGSFEGEVEVSRDDMYVSKIRVADRIQGRVIEKAEMKNGGLVLELSEERYEEDDFEDDKDRAIEDTVDEAIEEARQRREEFDYDEG